MKISCIKCFNAIAKIPLKFPKDGNILGAEILYNKAEIRCKKGHWENSDGKEKKYKNLLIFKGVVATKTNQNCPDFDA